MPTVHDWVGHHVSGMLDGMFMLMGKMLLSSVRHSVISNTLCVMINKHTSPDCSGWSQCLVECSLKESEDSFFFFPPHLFIGLFSFLFCWLQIADNGIRGSGPGGIQSNGKPSDSFQCYGMRILYAVTLAFYPGQADCTQIPVVQCCWGRLARSFFLVLLSSLTSI